MNPIDWDKVAEKLLNIADHHAQGADNALLLKQSGEAMEKRQLSEIFYGLAAAIQTGLERDE